MKIDDNLNVVIPLRSDDKGVKLYAYHTPIPKEVFKANSILLAATNTEIGRHGEYFQMGLGPRIATEILIKEAKKESQEADAAALLNEIKRLTTVLVSTESGWEHMPVDAAIRAKKVEQEEWEEVESDLIFFTCHYFLVKLSGREKAMNALMSLLQGLKTSSTITAFINSLQTSTTIGLSETKAA